MNFLLHRLFECVSNFVNFLQNTLHVDINTNIVNMVASMYYEQRQNVSVDDLVCEVKRPSLMLHFRVLSLRNRKSN